MGWRPEGAPTTSERTVHAHSAVSRETQGGSRERGEVALPVSSWEGVR